MPTPPATSTLSSDEAMAFTTDITGLIFYRSNSNYIDDNGFYMSPVFSNSVVLSGSEWSEGLLEKLNAGEVGIYWESFSEELYGTSIRLYYTLSDVDTPTMEINSSGLRYYTYDPAEELALTERFGSSKSSTQIIDSTIKAIAVEVATTNVNAEHTFKKIRYEVLDYDNLSSFKDEEATQNITVATSFASGSDSSMGSSY